MSLIIFAHFQCILYVHYKNICPEVQQELSFYNILNFFYDLLKYGLVGKWLELRAKLECSWAYLAMLGGPPVYV
jgi:hypothetical protein